MNIMVTYVCTDDIEETPDNIYIVIETIKVQQRKRLEAPCTTRSFLHRAQKLNVHTIIYDIIQVLWLGGPDNEATWVSASSLPSSVIKEFKEGICTTGIEQKDDNSIIMARKPLPLVLQNSISMIQNKYVGHNQLLKKPQGKTLINNIILASPD